MGEIQDLKILKECISEYIQLNTIKPANESIEKDISIPYRMGDVRLLLRLSLISIGPNDDNICNTKLKSIKPYQVKRLKNLIEKENWTDGDYQFLGHMISRTCEKRCVIPFLVNQIDWIVISILSASYLNSMILMRSVFELLMNVTTEFEEKGMKQRIEGIPFFNSREKNNIYKFWKHLCKWNHPYHEWLKNICPIFISHGPIYHPKLFNITISSLEKLLDIYLVIAKDHFGMGIKEFKKKCKESTPIDPIDFNKYPLFRKRIRL